jgi:hypothetical protein
MNIKLFVDGKEVPASAGDVKVVVEGLGADGDWQLHSTFGADGLVYDAVDPDGEVSTTCGLTYEEIVANMEDQAAVEAVEPGMVGFLADVFLVKVVRTKPKGKTRTAWKELLIETRARVTGAKPPRPACGPDCRHCKANYTAN